MANPEEKVRERIQWKGYPIHGWRCRGKISKKGQKQCLKKECLRILPKSLRGINP